MEIRKATKAQAKARVGLVGPSGSGKTMSALRIAFGLGKNPIVIDTENESSSKYAGKMNFDVLALTTFAPKNFIAAIDMAVANGNDVIIIDSLSHAWMGKGGALEMVDAAAKRTRDNSFAAWREVTPEHNALVNALVHCPVHLIVCMRSKSEWVLEPNEKGKMVPRRIGMAPIQRDGLEYEFDIVGDIDLDHNWVISKTRCESFDRRVVKLPDEQVGREIAAWLSDGVVPPPPPAPKPQPSKNGASDEAAKAAAQHIGGLVATMCGLHIDNARNWSDEDRIKFSESLEYTTGYKAVRDIPSANLTEAATEVNKAYEAWQAQNAGVPA